MATGSISATCVYSLEELCTDPVEKRPIYGCMLRWVTLTRQNRHCLQCFARSFILVKDIALVMGCVLIIISKMQT